VNALEAAALGTLQGLTEFLPISSSAHLLLARAFFGWDTEARFGLAFDVACHVGTLVAVLAYYRRDVVELTRAAVRPRTWLGGPGDSAALVRSIAMGTVPVGVVGLAAGDLVTGALRTVDVVGVTLALGAALMLAAERAGARTRDETTLGVWEALGLGLAQASALVPGVSRSGAVLVVAMFLGLRRERAARFAFLLGIPAIAAAGGKATLDLAAQGVPSGGMTLLAVGVVSSGIVGYGAVKFFMRYVSRHSLDGFAAYRLVLGAAALVWVFGS
jgi:undecaprenyl-diphosphatase